MDGSSIDALAEGAAHYNLLDGIGWGCRLLARYLAAVE